ncbi:hypothetical protein AGIG_G18918 [Arapaima gigas]
MAAGANGRKESEERECQEAHPATMRILPLWETPSRIVCWDTSGKSGPSTRSSASHTQHPGGISQLRGRFLSAGQPRAPEPGSNPPTSTPAEEWF